MANTKISALPVFTGDTSGSHLVMNDVANTATYTVSKETLFSGYYADSSSFNSRIIAATNEQDLGQYATTSSLNSFTSSYSTGSFTGSFKGNLDGSATTSSYVNPLSQSVIVTGGITHNGVYTGNYIDGVVLDYVDGNARFSAGPNDGFTFYNNFGLASASLFSISTKGNVSSSAGFTGSFLGTGSYATQALTASYALNALTTVDTGSLLTTSSFNNFTSSYKSGSFTGSFSGSFTGSLLGNIAGTATYAGLVSTQNSSTNQDYTFLFVVTGSNGYMQTYADATPGVLYNPSTNQLKATGSLFGTASFAVTASYWSGSINNATSASYATTASYALNANATVNTGSLATTSSNVFKASQTISGSLTITNDLIVFGSSSINYITSSQLNIGTNLITVNTNSPSVRFGGIAAIDSGSVPQRSGSLLFDSLNDQWIFVHNTLGTITSSALIMGPETYNNVGNETTPTTNKLIKSVNAEHIGDSNITDNGIVVSINSNTQITGSLTATSFTGSLAGTASYATIALTASYFSGSISNSVNATSASYAETASYALNASATIDTGSLTLTSSFFAYTSSLNTFSASILTFTSSLSASIVDILIETASINRVTSSLQSFSASINLFTASINLQTSSLLSYTASINAKTGSFATTGSNIFNGNQTITGSLTVTNNTAVVSSVIAANSSSLSLASGSNLYIDGTGLLSVTGSSYLTNTTISGSVTITGSFIQSGSLISYGPNTLIGNSTITGSVTVATGSITLVSGSITMPNRPGVRVTGAGGAKVAITRLSGSYLNVDWQQTNAWDNASGTFTAPIAGLYQVNLIVRTNSNSLGTISQLIVYKNNTGGVTGTAQVMVEFGINTTMNHTGGSTICQLAVGDTLRMVVASGEISFDSNDNFSVAYIG